MRILLASNYQPPHMGGIEYAARSLKQCWRDMGHEVTWITTDIPPTGALNTHDNVRIPAWNIFETLFQINSPIVFPNQRKEIREAVDYHDVINVHSLAPGLTSEVLKMAIKLKKPLVATQHVGVIPLKLKFLSSVQQNVLCKRAREITEYGAPLTFVGKAVRDWFVQHAGLPEDKVVMTPAGIDQDDFYFAEKDERKQLQEKWSHVKDFLNVLFVGRFYEKKGLSLIREIAGQLPEVTFTMVGSGPDDPDKWGHPNVRVIPYVTTEELRELYAAHDIFLMPSVGEGWPAVVPQAMACGLPCLISEETYTGYDKDPDRFIVCTRSSHVLVETLTDAANGKIPLLTQRKEVSEYARNVWDWKATAKIYERLFKEQMGEPEMIS